MKNCIYNEILDCSLKMNLVLLNKSKRYMIYLTLLCKLLFFFNQNYIEKKELNYNKII